MLYPFFLVLTIVAFAVAALLFAILARTAWQRALALVVASLLIASLWWIRFPMWGGTMWHMYWSPAANQSTPTTPAPNASASSYEVLAANGWPIDFGQNRTMTVNAPEYHDLVVNYGREGFTADGKQIQVCGVAMVPAGESIRLIFWAGNAEAVTKGYGVEYAQFTYANRADPQNGDTRCQMWESYNFSPVPQQ